MFKNILVPLDGSRLSEAALPPAAFLAEKLKASVMLLHVIEQDAPSEVHNEHHLIDSVKADAYLKEVAQKAFAPQVKVGTHVHTAPVSDVARSIVEHATAEFHPDLIVTCTHGKGGMRDVLFGSIAQQVVARGHTPLLLVKPVSADFKLDRILLPLDPDSEHDESFSVAESLAEVLHSELRLLSVIPTYATLAGKHVMTSSLLPASTTEFLNLRQEAALVHLQEHVEKLKSRGIASTAEVARGDPASLIVKLAKENGIDLIILSTHRKAGMDAFWALSVAPKVVQTARTPLLLIPLTEGSSSGN